MAAVHNHHHHHCVHDHHDHPVEQSNSDKLFHILEKVSAIALGVFAVMASAELFVPFFALGTAVGLYQYFSSADHHADGSGGGACSQGFLEQLTGVKLPPLISLGANLAVTWCHIDHHTSIFVPIIGLSLGAWAGQSLGDLGSRIKQIVRPTAA